MARDAFTYWHIPIVAGIVVLAVIDEQTLVHPLASSHPDFVLTLLGGSILFLGGTMVFTGNLVWLYNMWMTAREGTLIPAGRLPHELAYER